MNIVFMGTPSFSVPILEALIKAYQVSLVVTQPDKPVGRKKVLTPSPVKALALKYGINVFQPKKIRTDYQAVLEAKPDLIITAAYGQIIPTVLLDAPRLKAINVHASLLPKYRGGAPIQRAIMNQDRVTGVTIMYMEEKMDAGNIIAQREIAIHQDDTSETLFNKLSEVGKALLLDTLPSIINKTNPSIKQATDLVTYAPIIKPSEEWLDFNETAIALDAKIRAFYPEPNTFTLLSGMKLKVIEARVLKDESAQAINPGEVASVSKKGFSVQCKKDQLFIKTLQLESKKAMPASDFMNGLGKTLIKVGTKLGE